MKTKIVYVLVSSEKDMYLEQTLVSILSLKKYNPTAYVTLIVDDLTNESFIGKRNQLLGQINEKVVVSLDRNLSAKIRSRLLKTSIRNNMNDDFLYVDSDTIIFSDLSEIDNFDFEMAAVVDCHCDIKKNPYITWVEEDAKKVGNIKLLENKYFNSGVIYVKDNQNTRDFYNHWLNFYLQTHLLVNSMDQPSFNMVNNELKMINEIDGSWNCQLKFGFKFFHTTKILHILTTSQNGFNENLHFFQDEDVYKKVASQDINPYCDLDYYFSNINNGWNDQCVELVFGKELSFLNNKNILSLKNIYNNESFLLLLFKLLTYLYKLKKKIFSFFN